MAKQMVVAHVTKYNSSSTSSGALGRHIDRKHVPDNARKEDQDKNFSLVTSPTGSLKKDIDQRITEGYKKTKKIRESAVRSCGVIFSGSHEQMKKIEKADMIDEWAKDTYDFACDRWGKENVVRATVHMDEKTPHMHLHFVPLTPDGRLSAKEIVSRDNLKALQNDYAEIMQEYGLERGQQKSREKHITTAQYYQNQAEIKKTAKDIEQSPNREQLIEHVLQEYENVTQEKKKEQQKKINPNKENTYEKPRRQAEREENKQNRASRKDAGEDFGFSR